MATSDLDISQTLADCLPVLKAASLEQLVWWNIAQLYSMADQGVKRLARTAGAFVERDTSIQTAAEISTYALPSDHVSTIHASFDGVALRPGSVQDMEALDADWVTAVDYTPKFFLHVGGMDFIAVYPAPDGSIPGPLALILQRFPAALSATQTLLNGPVPLADYIEFYVLGQALGAESKGAMPEVAQWFDQLCSLFESVAVSYWGAAD